MGRFRKLARRSFLIGSTAVAGGVAFGTYYIAQPKANPLLTNLKDGEAAFNAFVKISGDAITLITPHSDVGQGVLGAQALLIAEELDVEPGQFVTSFGDPAGAYFNTAMGEEGAPFLSTDKSSTAEMMRTVMGGVIRLLNMQGTGGSTSMPDSFDKLRVAGAVARETLKAAAAKKYAVSVSDLSTKAAHVILPDGKKVAYQDLAADAAAIEPVTGVELRAPEDWRMIGKENLRPDIIAKSTGTMDYGIDIYLDDMVNAVVKTNPRNMAPMNGFDASKAEAMPGVDKVVKVANGVAVIAKNTWVGFQALEAVEFDWGEAKHPPEQDAHWQEVEASFTPERLNSQWRNDGDVDADIEADGKAVEVSYRAPYVAHQPLEPFNCVIKYAEDKASATCWTAHQVPAFVQQFVARAVGCPTDAVKFHNLYGGGSFGHRLEFEHVKQTAELAAMFPGKPVKLTYSREEDFAHDFTRQITASRGTGTVKEGQVESFDLSIASVSVLASQMARMGMSVPGPDAQIAAGAWNLPYAFKSYRMNAYKVPELAPTSSWRSVGASTAGFFADGLMDELCHAAGADPLEERLRLIKAQGDSHADFAKVLETVADMSGWRSELVPDPNGYQRGRGVAFVESFGVPTAEVVEVTDTPEGIRVDKVFIAQEVGTVVDPLNYENQVQGGVVWALGHAINSEMTMSDGMWQQTNYHSHEGMRMYQTPEIQVKGLENGDHVKGAGEPMVPPTAPALANAIFAATGTRIREMPFNKHMDFV